MPTNPYHNASDKTQNNTHLHCNTFALGGVKKKGGKTKKKRQIYYFLSYLYNSLSSQFLYDEDE